MEDLFDEDVTIVNQYFDKVEKKTKYKISYVKAFWCSSNGITIKDTQLIKQDGITVIILIKDSRNKPYQKPKEFQKEQITWTLQNSDYLIKGLVKNFTTITNMLEEYEDVIKITNIDINDNGNEEIWNFEIRGS